MKRLYPLFKAFACSLVLFVVKPGVAQRALINVTATQLSDLPKLTEGAQGWTDYDGDKLPDLLITGKTSSGTFLTRLYHNTGKGFEDKSSLMPNLPQIANSAVAWGDYDKDGKPDLFISGNTGTSFISKVYHNKGGSFAETIISSDEGDVLPNLAFGTANWIEAGVGATFTRLFVTGKTDNGPYSALYYFLGLPSSDNCLISNITNSALGLPGLPALQNSAVACKDFNKDGNPDFMITGDNGTANTSKLYLSSPLGYQDMSGSISSLPQVNFGSFDATDYDGDGKTDIFMTGRTAAGPVSKLYHNIIGAEWAPFEVVNTNIAGVKRAKVGWADYDQLDETKLPDVMVSGIAADGSISGKLYHNTATGFEDVSGKLLVSKPMADGVVAWGDYDNNGSQDLLYSGIYDLSSPGENRGFILLNNSDGLGDFSDDSKNINETSNPVKIPAMPVAYSSASWVDFDHDNEIDLFYTGQMYDEAINDTYSQRYFFVNDGTGKLKNTYDWKVTDPYAEAFPLALDEIPSVENGTLAWGDFDGDKFPDLLMLGEVEPAKNENKDKTRSPHTYLFKNTGDKKSYMTDVTSLLPNYHNLAYGDAAWADFNNDGWQDLIMTGADGTNYYTQLYQNKGGTGFSEVSNLLPGLPQLAYSSVKWGDYDGDGRQDLILSGKDMSGAGIAKLYHNTASGFVDASSLLPNMPGVFTGALNWVDYNGDGLLDLSIIGDSQDGPVSLLYRNQGSKITFEDQSSLLPGLPQVAEGSATFGDYDNDGRPDLYITGQNSSSVNAAQLYHNIPSGFETSTLLLGDTAVSNSSVSWVDYDNDGWNDLMITGSAGTSVVTRLLHNISLNVTALIPGLPGLNNGSVAWGDYDNDGRMDMMVTGWNNLTTNAANLLYHNTGNGFEDKTSLLPGLPRFTLNSAAWADYDNDGRLDLVITGYPFLSSEVYVKLYHNTGTVFSDVSGLLPNPGKLAWTSVTWADYDNDGKKDLFITGTTFPEDQYTHQLFHNTGSGFEDKSGLIPGVTDANGGVAVWGDYDGDGYPDLLATGNNNSLVTKLYHNNKGATFTDTTVLLPNLPTNVSATIAAWADYDNDGKLDLFVNGALYNNTGNGFSETTGLMPGVQSLTINSAAWTDHDNDGFADLLLSTTKGTLLFLNTRTGFELTTLIPGEMSGNATVGDYDNDSRLDILQLNESGNTLYHNLTRLTNTSPDAPTGLKSLVSLDGLSVTLTWNRAKDAQTPSPGLNYNLYVGTTPGGQDVLSPMSDLNNGYRRIVQAGNSQTISYTLNLAPNQTYYWSVQAVDAGFAASRFAPEQQFNTTQTFDQTHLLPGLKGVSNGDAVWGDYDNDGKLDLFIFGFGNTDYGYFQVWSKLYHNTGNGFEDKSGLLPGLPGFQNGQAAWADYDNDGKLDLLITGQDSLNLGSTILYHNTGSGFENKTSVIPGIPSLYYSAVAFGDYDNDGYKDLVLSGAQSGGNIGLATKLYHNTGNGAFQDTTSLLPGQPLLGDGSLNWIDFNKDGKLDLFMTGTTFNGIQKYLFQNTGKGFTDVSTLIPNFTGTEYGSSAWADYDLDGYPDLFVNGQTVDQQPSSAISRLYHNNKGTGFTDVSTLLPGLPGLSSSAAAWGDYDNDGRPDLIISGFSTANAPTTIVYLNTNSGFIPAAFAKLLPQAGGSTIALGDYDNDSRLDLFMSGYIGDINSISKLFHNPGPQNNTVPQSPASLSVQLSPDGTTATLTWQSSSDQDTPGDGLHYNVYVSDTPGSQNIVGAAADISTGTRLVAETGNSQGNSFTVTGLVPGKTYYWSVQAIDPSFAGSVFAEEQSFTTAVVPSKPVITWGKISAENEGRRNRIEWNTKYEERGDWFVVEKLNRNGSYTAIDKQYTKGRPSSYTAYDWQPEFGKNSYRVKIYHRDGSYKTSEVVSVYIGKNDDCGLKAFPNPVHRFVTITLDCDNNFEWNNWSPWQGRSGGLLSVINGRGQTVMRVRMTDNRVQLDLSRFSDGLYYVKYDDGHDTKTIKIIKR